MVAMAKLQVWAYIWVVLEKASESLQVMAETCNYQGAFSNETKLANKNKSFSTSLCGVFSPVRGPKLMEIQVNQWEPSASMQTSWPAIHPMTGCVLQAGETRNVSLFPVSCGPFFKFSAPSTDAWFLCFFSVHWGRFRPAHVKFNGDINLYDGIKTFDRSTEFLRVIEWNIGWHIRAQVHHREPLIPQIHGLMLSTGSVSKNCWYVCCDHIAELAGKNNQLTQIQITIPVLSVDVKLQIANWRWLYHFGKFSLYSACLKIVQWRFPRDSVSNMQTNILTSSKKPSSQWDIHFAQCICQNILELLQSHSRQNLTNKNFMHKNQSKNRTMTKAFVLVFSMFVSF